MTCHCLKMLIFEKLYTYNLDITILKEQADDTTEGKWDITTFQ